MPAVIPIPPFKPFLWARSFLLQAALLNSANVGAQLFERANHAFLLRSGDSREQLCLKRAVRRAQLGDDLLARSSQSDQCIAIILRVEPPTKHALGLKLLD